MGELSPGAVPSARASEGRLDSWKEIAAYLNRDMTTVQRWEKREGMPVHRHLHGKMGSVYAFRAELDEWVRSRKLRAAQENGNNAASPGAPEPPPQPVTPSGTKWRLTLLLAAAGAALAIGTGLWLVEKTDYFWRNPIEGAQFQTLTDFDGVSRDAAISRDGHLVAFLSDHEGPMDLWITQVGSGQFHNLTHGTIAGIVNSLVRTVSFSADSSLVTFWTRKPGGSNNGISIWAVPTLGGQPRLYLDGVAEFDWSHDGSRLVYHTSAPGDPLFASNGLSRSDIRPIFRAPAGLHCHFPVWSPDGAFIYFVEGSVPDRLDIWRVAANGGAAERITSHSSYVTHPVLLDSHTLIYLANDSDGSGPWLYGMDPAQRRPHRLTSGPERYTSLAASADGRHLVATLANPKRTLWHMPLTDRASKPSTPRLIALTTTTGFAPRFGPNYLLYVSSTAGNDSIWKFNNGTGTELWSGQGSQVSGAPVVSPDGQFITFSVRQNGRSRLYVMQADGGNAHSVTDSLDLQGSPAWAPDGRCILFAANSEGIPHLFRLPVDGSAPVSFVKEYSVDAVWAPDGRFVLYSGPDIGTTFSIKAAKPDGTAYPLPSVTLTRGARHLVFTSDGRSLILLRGEIQHKDLWAIDLATGTERQLTMLPADFDVRDFDLSPDGREVVLERGEERSDIVLVERGRR